MAILILIVILISYINSRCIVNRKHKYRMISNTNTTNHSVILSLILILILIVVLIVHEFKLKKSIIMALLIIYT